MANEEYLWTETFGLVSMQTIHSILNDAEEKFLCKEYLHNW